MNELYGIGNPGFSFTKTYLGNIINLMDVVENCRSKNDVTYLQFQQLTKDPSRTRMLVPFLRNMGVISDLNFIKNNQVIDFNNFYTPNADPFLKFMDVYKNVDLDDHKINSLVMDIFKEMMRYYFPMLCNNRKEYDILYKYLCRFRTIDKNEFFAITTFEMNGVSKIEAYLTAEEWIIAYRTNEIDISNYIIKNNINSYSYIMQILSDFNVCKKVNNYFQIITED